MPALKADSPDTWRCDSQVRRLHTFAQRKIIYASVNYRISCPIFMYLCLPLGCTLQPDILITPESIPFSSLWRRKSYRPLCACSSERSQLFSLQVYLIVGGYPSSESSGLCIKMQIHRTWTVHKFGDSGTYDLFFGGLYALWLGGSLVYRCKRTGPFSQQLTHGSARTESWKTRFAL